LPITKVLDEANFLSDLVASERSAGGVPLSIQDTDANFYRQVQASVLIGHVLDLVNVAKPFSERNQSRFRLLDSQLRRALQLSLEIETSQLNSVSEALSMNRR
jgi:hypothetical protein